MKEKIRFSRSVDSILFSKAITGDVDIRKALTIDMVSGDVFDYETMRDGDSGAEWLAKRGSAQVVLSLIGRADIWHSMIPMWKAGLEEVIKKRVASNSLAEIECAQKVLSFSIESGDFKGLEILLKSDCSPRAFWGIRSSYNGMFYKNVLAKNYKDEKSEAFIEFLNNLVINDAFAIESSENKARKIVKSQIAEWRDGCIPDIAFNAKTEKMVEWVKDNAKLATDGELWAFACSRNMTAPTGGKAHELVLNDVERVIQHIGHLSVKEKNIFWKAMREDVSRAEVAILDDLKYVHKYNIQLMERHEKLQELIAAHHPLKIPRDEEMINKQVHAMAKAIIKIAESDDKNQAQQDEISKIKIHYMQWIPVDKLVSFLKEELNIQRGDRVKAVIEKELLLLTVGVASESQKLGATL